MKRNCCPLILLGTKCWLRGCAEQRQEHPPLPLVELCWMLLKCTHVASPVCICMSQHLSTSSSPLTAPAGGLSELRSLTDTKSHLYLFFVLALKAVFHHNHLHDFKTWKMMLENSIYVTPQPQFTSSFL